MKIKYIDIDGYWSVLFIYDYGKDDVEEMAEIMDSFGMDDANIAEALDVLSHVNTGMAVSNFGLRMSAMFISETTSLPQFADSVTHEIDHVQDAICEYYDVPLGSEDAAWTQGYIARGIMYHLSCDCE